MSASLCRPRWVWPQYLFVQRIARLFLSQLIILEPSGCHAHTTTEELLIKISHCQALDGYSSNPLCDHEMTPQRVSLMVKLCQMAGLHYI